MPFFKQLPMLPCFLPWRFLRVSVFAVVIVCPMRSKTNFHIVDNKWIKLTTLNCLDGWYYNIWRYRNTISIQSLSRNSIFFIHKKQTEVTGLILLFLSAKSVKINLHSSLCPECTTSWGHFLCQKQSKQLISVCFFIQMCCVNFKIRVYPKDNDFILSRLSNH